MILCGPPQWTGAEREGPGDANAGRAYRGPRERGDVGRCGPRQRPCGPAGRCRLPFPRFPSSVPRSSSGAAADHSAAGRPLPGVCSTAHAQRTRSGGGLENALWLRCSPASRAVLHLAWTGMEPSGAWTEHTFKVRDYWGACWWGQQYQVERAGGANNIGAPDHGAAGAPLLVLLIIRLLFIIRPRAAVYGAAVCPRAAVYNSPWCS